MLCGVLVAEKESMSPWESIRDHPRVTVRSACPPDFMGRCVVYWMQRAQRAEDNHALNVTINVANALGKPAVVFLGIMPFYACANLRHYTFLAQGIADIAAGLQRRQVGFVPRPWPDHHLLKFCQEVNPCVIIGDENPLREPEKWRRTVAERSTVPLWTVDADVIVPSKLLRKEQFAARTVRPRIHAMLPDFLRPMENPRAHTPWTPPRGLSMLAPDAEFLSRFPLDRSVPAVSGIQGGSVAGRRALARFVGKRLAGYAQRRNHPDVEGTSRLSPYLHFGHLGPLTAALAVRDADAPEGDREAFLEEMIVRRELAVNFVRFNPHYDELAGAEPWALKTLKEHARDERPYIYTAAQLENAETHDALWNAAQKQMVRGGWMHGYLRMYWGKKILEWTRSPEEAFALAVRLNDQYELDGRDPNGYAGIAWAIAGKHDRAWGPERPVYGKIRYMSNASTSRKFNAAAYIRKVEEPR
jgi:deoxyribodipyrimidine photo-lyase